MEDHEEFADSMKPKNSQTNSERQTTVKKQNRRPQSEKRAPKQSQHSRQVSIIQYVQNLVVKQQKAQRKGRYSIALNCKSKLQHLKDHLLSQRIRQLKDDQKDDRRKIKQAHENQILKIEVAWMKLSQSYDRKVEQMIEKWEIKKQKQLIRLEKEIQRISEKQFKLRSKDLRDLQKTKHYFLKIQDYAQAKLVDKQIKQLTYSLFQKVQEDIHNKILHMRAAIKEKHSKEYVVLKDRIKRAKEQQAMHCSKQKKKLIKKYDNIVKRLNRQQFLQIQDLQDHSKPPIQNPLRLSRRNAEWIIENSAEPL